MDSSVIFLVVIGLWLCVLVPYWLRRREDLSTSRTADRFSAAMRVLTRRPDPDELPVRERGVVPVLRSPRLDHELEEAGDELLELEAAPTVVVEKPRRRGRRVRAALGGVLVLAFVAVPVLTALSFAELLPVWSAMPAAGVVVVLVLGLRATAPRPRAVEVVEPVLVPDEVETVEDLEDDLDVEAREELFDEDAHRRVEDEARIRRLAEESARAADVPYRLPEPGEWTPVAVPLPAYLLKPHARPTWQARPQPLEPAARTGGPVPLDAADDDDIPAYAPPRRVVGG